MFKVADRLVYEIVVGTNRFQIEPGNIGSMLINENVNTFLPTLRLEVNDVAGRMTRDTQLKDAVLLRTKLSDKPVQDHTVFRIFNIPIHRQSTSAQFYRINGTLDFIDYLRGIAPKSYKGTSFEVLGEIAQSLGMQYDGDETNDAQIWLPSNKSYAKFCDYIASHGYVDDKSCMALCVKSDGTMLYKNIANLVRKEPKAKIYAGPVNRGEDNAFLAVSYESQNNSGVMNLLFNHGAKIIQESLKGDIIEIAKVQATKFSRELDINRDMKRELGLVRDELRPIECGNQHPRFEQASYQNKRIKATFGVQVDLLLIQDTGIELLDIIEIDIPNRANSRYQAPLKSKYIVTAVAKAMAGAQYYQKIRAVTTGFSS